MSKAWLILCNMKDNRNIHALLLGSVVLISMVAVYWFTAPLPTVSTISASTVLLLPTASATVPHRIALGASITDAPWQPAKIDEFAKLVGAMPAIVMWYQDWA